MKNVLKLLKEEQKKKGYLTCEDFKTLSKREGLALSTLFDVASFYSFIYIERKGKNIIKVCKSIPCYLKGEENILKALERILNIKAGGVTPDGRFSIELVNCIGCCDKAPAIMIHERIYGELTEKSLKGILEGYLNA